MHKAFDILIGIWCILYISGCIVAPIVYDMDIKMQPLWPDFEFNQFYRDILFITAGLTGALIALVGEKVIRIVLSVTFCINSLKEYLDLYLSGNSFEPVSMSVINYTIICIIIATYVYQYTKNPQGK